MLWESQSSVCGKLTGRGINGSTSSPLLILLARISSPLSASSHFVNVVIEGENASAGHVVVHSVVGPMVDDRRLPRVTVLGGESVYFLRQPSPAGPSRQVAYIRMPCGVWQCTRWQIQHFQTGMTSRHFQRGVAAAVNFVHVVAATSAWCCGTGQRDITF